MNMITFWIAQSLAIPTILFAVLGFLQKEKGKQMIFITLTNLCLLTIYILLGRMLACLLVSVLTVRSIVSYVYTKLNKKSDIKMLLLFELAIVIVCVFTYQDWIDIFMIANTVIMAVTAWQVCNMRLYRIGYLLSSCLLITFDALTGAYAVIASEVILALIVVAQMIKYRHVENTYHITEEYYRAMNHFMGTRLVDRKHFTAVLSDRTNDINYNFAVKYDDQNMAETLEEIDTFFDFEQKRKMLYIPFDYQKSDTRMDTAETLEMYFPVCYHDAWMKLITGYNLASTHCKLKHMTFTKVDQTAMQDIEDVYIDGYLSKDKTEVTSEERKNIDAIRGSYGQVDTKSEYREDCYLAYHLGVPVSMLFIVSNKKVGYITKVATIRRYRRKHIASHLIQYGISDIRKKGVQDFFLATSKYSTAEKFYAYNSFVEILQAYCFDVSDKNKQKEYLALQAKKEIKK